MGNFSDRERQTRRSPHAKSIKAKSWPSVQGYHAASSVMPTHATMIQTSTSLVYNIGYAGGLIELQVFLFP